MLILKNPLTLQSISTFEIYSDSLGEKICGNYQSFGAAVTGEDLIHMTVQEPDVYVNIENSSPFLVDNQVHVDNQVRLELVNRLVNRLMLYHTRQFTYQDEVFVAILLQKLGVTDINAFMKQVKFHMEANELSVSLINRYFDEGRAFAYTVSELLENTFTDRQELAVIQNEYKSDRHLHNDIYKRLMTAECSNTVYRYQNPVQVRERIAGSFREIEWIRQADRIQLSQLRENIYWQTNPAVYCDYSSYETKPLAVSELTRQKVIGRMCAAILENIVSVAGYALQYRYNSTNVWKNYSRIFYGSSENVLERFHFFQESGGAGAVQLAAYTVRMNELAQDELHLTQLLTFVDRSESPLDGDALYEDMRKNIVLTLLENQNLQRQLTNEIQIVQQAGAQEQSEVYYLDVANQYYEERKRFEAVYRVLRQKKSENYFSTAAQGQAADEKADILETDRALELLTAIDAEPVLRERAADRNQKIDRALRDAVMHGNSTNELPARAQPPESGQAVYELIHRYAEQGADSDVPLMENIELLEQINQHNLYMKQLIDSREPARDTPRRVVVDRVLAREAALRALDDPEEVLREIYERAADKKRIPREIASPVPDEIERILSVTDERTRHYYERLMGYRDDDAPDAKTGHDGGRGDRPVPPEQARQEADAENLFLETVRAVLNTTEQETQRLYEQGVVYQTADTVQLQPYAGEDLVPLTQEEQVRRGEIQKKVYALLRWIDDREHAYRTDTTVRTGVLEEQIRDVQLQHQTVGLFHREELSDIQEMVALEHRNTLHQQVASVLYNVEKKVQLVHKTREQMNQEVVDEVLETIENSTFSRQTVRQKNEETLSVEHQIEKLRNELITQSREQITHMMAHSMKTHVHEISDMVYLELERRLKNEQRRRGL